MKRDGNHCGTDEARSHEGRRPKEGRGPKAEQSFHSGFGFRVSDFLRPSALGFRISAAVLVAALSLNLLGGCSSTPPPPPRPAAVGQAEQAAAVATKLTGQQNWSAAAREWQRAVERYRLLNDRAGEAIALHNLAHAKRQLSDLDAARDLLEQAAAINDELGRKEEWWRNQIALLQIESQSGQSAALDARFEKLAASPPSPAQLQGLFLNELGLRQQDRGEFEKAGASFRQAGKAFDAARDRAGLAAVLANRARLDAAQNRHAAALEKWARALAMFEALADVRGIAAAQAGRGRTLLAAGQNLPLAENLLRRACDNYRMLKTKADLATALASLEASLTAQGKTAEAAQVATERQALTQPAK